METFETSIVSTEMYTSCALSAVHDALKVFQLFSDIYQKRTGRVLMRGPHLFGGVGLTENRVDALGFGEHLGLRVDGFEFFAGQPELDVLLAELFPEELREDLHPV